MHASEFIDKNTESTAADIKSYHYTLILVQTKDDKVFGAFVTAFPYYDPKKAFIGTQESFVFRVRPGDFQCYQKQQDGLRFDPSQNTHFMHCDYKALTIGSGGDGPAIRLD